MAEIVVIGNYVSFPSTEDICRHDNDETIIFLGKMDYEPNVTGVTYFVKNIYPELRKNHPHLKFQIVGARPAPEITALKNINGIEVTGYVESTVPYFQNAAIVVAPMLSGAGVQNKIIQAMSYGCCVVTTTIGAEGLNLTGDDLLIFNSDKEWIKGLDGLLRDREWRIRIGSNARETISRTLVKDKIFKQFRKLLENIK